MVRLIDFLIVIHNQSHINVNVYDLHVTINYEVAQSVKVQVKNETGIIL